MRLFVTWDFGDCASALYCVGQRGKERCVARRLENTLSCHIMAENLQSATQQGAGSTSITLKPLTAEHLPQLKTLNSVIFPVKYHERVYQDALACGPVSVLAFDGRALIGGIVCRLEAQVDGRAELYIISLGVLAPYRGQGIGSRLLHESLAFCQEDPAIRKAKLHVHVGNEEALLFYQRQGFNVQETIKGYYKRLNPPDAAVLVKVLHDGEKAHEQHPPALAD